MVYFDLKVILQEKVWVVLYYKSKEMMGSYRLPFQKTPQISKEFWSHRVRINQIISEHPQFYATTVQSIF